MAAFGKPHDYVRVMYDYDYMSQAGHRVSIRVDEEYLLLKQTSQEWWYVVRKGAAQACGKVSTSEAFYVPASYVEVVHRTVIALGEENKKMLPVKAKKPPPRPPKPKTTQPKVSDEELVLKDLDDLLESEYQTLSSLHVQNGNEADSDPTHGSDSDMSVDKPSNSKPTLERLVKSTNDLDTEVKIDANSNIHVQQQQHPLPDYANLADVRASMSMQPVPEAGPCYANVDELRDSLSSLPSSDPPHPGADESPSLELGDGWGLYRDLHTNKQYYHHKESGESSWRPPAANGGSKPQQAASPSKPSPPPIRVNSFGTRIQLSSTDSSECDQSSQRLSNRSSTSSMSAPAGWKENVNEAGDVFYVSDVTNEKWQCSIDRRGRQYYYREGSVGDSAWELPQLPASRHPSVDSGLHRLCAPPLHTINKPGVRASWAAGDQHHANHSKLTTKLSTPQLSPTQMKEVSEELLTVTTGAGEGNSSIVDNRHGSQSNIAPLSPKLATAASRETSSVDIEQEEEEEEEEDEEESNTEELDTLVPPPAIKRPAEKKGVLNKAKIQENGKKLKKNWMSCYAVSTGSLLYLYKDQKAAQPKEKAPSGKPDTVIELHGATVDQSPKLKSSKKHVLQVSTEAGTEYLFQAQDTEIHHQWFIALRNNAMVKVLPPVAPPAAQAHGGSQRSLDQFSEGGRSPKPDKRGRESPDDTLSNPAHNTRIRERLMRWLFTRPSMGDLEKKGYIKERVFGGRLESLAVRDGVSVPRFLTLCAAAIERRGLCQDGIYRVSGNLAQIQKLRFLVDSGEPYELENPEWEIHVLTGALKMFFRELKDPVFPFYMFDSFISAISKLQERGKRLKVFKQLIKELPAPNRDTLNALLQHLIKVTNYSSENRMQTQNVAIVFGPTLMWPEIESANIAVSMVYQGQIVEFLIQEHKLLF